MRISAEPTFPCECFFQCEINVGWPFFGQIQWLQNSLNAGTIWGKKTAHFDKKRFTSDFGRHENFASKQR